MAIGTLSLVIASAKKAPRYGSGRLSGKLYVDGHDTAVFRKAEIGFKPATPRQGRALLRLLDASREVYNASLQERRDAYEHTSQTRIALFDQFKQVTDLRGSRDDVLAWGIQPVRWAMRRVDDAFGAFFARVKDGATPGYPRFKGPGRWNTVGFDEPKGWKLNLDGTKKRATPHLYVQGLGDIPLSKAAARQFKRYIARGGEATTLTLTRANREGTAWRACVGFDKVAVTKTEPELGPDSMLGIDRGVAVLVAGAAAADFAGDPGQLLHHTDDLKQRLEVLRRKVERLQAERARYEQYGNRWRRLSKQIAKAHHKASNLVENWARHTAKQIVAENAVVVLEDLNFKNMTKSAKGTVQDPGKNVAAKAGLNRSLLEGAHGKQAQWVRVKAEEAGRRIWGVNPAYTSQRCSSCTRIDAVGRVSRDVFYCGHCGHYEHADVNAARNIRALGHAAEQAWVAAGRPLLERPKPRLRRRKVDAASVRQQRLSKTTTGPGRL